MENFIATTHKLCQCQSCISKGYSDMLGPPYFSVHADLRTQCYPLKPLKNAICLRAPGKQRYFHYFPSSVVIAVRADWCSKFNLEKIVPLKTMTPFARYKLYLVFDPLCN